VNIQTSATADSQTAFITAIEDRIENKYQAFQVPFSERRALLVLVDALLVLLAGQGAFLLWQRATGIPLNTAHIGARWYWFPILLGGWWSLAWLNDLYDIPSSNQKILSAVRVAIVGTLGLIIDVAAFFVTPHALPLFFIYFLLIALPTIIIWRWTYATVFNAPPFRHRVLIVGAGERGRAIASALGQEPLVNYKVLGYLDDDLATPGEALDGLPVLGREADLPHLVRQLQIHEVVVAIESNLVDDLFQLLVDCQAQGVRVSQMPDLYEKLNRRIPIQHVDHSWVLDVMQNLPVFNRFQLGIKRLLDLVLGIVGLLVLTPMLLLVAVAIRLDSAGSIFYRQIRCGRAGRPFSIIKFRTMYSDAEQDGKPRWATKDDVRITRVGHFLRKMRLDELPQVINVLRGEMSIVGPRPERPEFIGELEQKIPFYRTRLTVQPGLTGWAQTHYHYGNSVDDALMKLQYDLYYLRYQSLWLDLYIIFRTFGVLLRFGGT
jgi:exopolysaccharide biosynthesis polyprenyl glycosylphosphotransferase